MARNKRIALKEVDKNVSYLYLRDYPHGNRLGAAKRTISVHHLIEDYDGPYIAIDLDEAGRPIGIEIIYGTSRSI